MRFGVHKTNLGRNINGSVLAEAALAIPLLVGITFFIIEFGNVLYLSNSLNQVSRAAARFASVTPSYTTQQLIDASGAMSVLPSTSKLTLTSNPAPGSARSIGATITITAQYNYTPIINPFGLLESNKVWAPILRGVSVTRSEVANVP